VAQYQSGSFASVTSAIAALCSWGLAAAGAWGQRDVETGAAVTWTLIAVLWQLTRRRERQERERARLDADRTLLIRTLSGAVPAQRGERQLRPARPFRAPRAL
jgi:hypothetical protein